MAFLHLPPIRWLTSFYNPPLVFDLSKDEKEARIFSEKELNQIKGREPSLAPAIDSMKEEVKDDED
ncbi:hypothetical protein LMB37_10515 [Limosilactobacillus reuteri]|uniref:Uncharacterized protein n=1 Tax=Limosilactobacillus reuteri (strain ATCC 55730 / SD2112) TaxID=491077 RepID=F8DPW3_LIMRS|nr:hypothetical protein [Limosilactobacillus reuteri]AEI58290.1 hypothetical protein HMPREF0538_22084 [Limosilactobacillus reuteri SD2112]MCC4452765.1 hypothetical protein [Limosilactobacillus reuteri]MCC4453459.1 hypothetical protein [Limosilactobacillus reuteri]MCC4459374.1 hypothetical protein [Limosilactobacillus reuteri]MCC4485065.1 hypothetical protein [Limosilactobacillus reuteri]